MGQSLSTTTPNELVVNGAKQTNATNDLNDRKRHQPFMFNLFFRVCFCAIF